jgi:hypothetical protein
MLNPVYAFRKPGFCLVTVLPIGTVFADAVFTDLLTSVLPLSQIS